MLRAWPLILLMFSLLPAEGWAQVRFGSRVPGYSLRAADYVAVTYIPPYPEDAGKDAGESAATFDIRFSTNFPTEAREAFRYAAQVWGRYLTSSVPIVVEAEWTSLPEGTLGSAGPLLVGNFTGAEYRNAWYPSALANSIAGRDLSAERADIFARFNSSFQSWYFGLDGQVPSDRYDFVTVILHELGHGLGFTGSFEVDDGDTSNGDECPNAPAGWGCWGIASSTGSTPFPMVFDLFAEDDDNVSLLVESVYPNPSTELATALQSQAIFFDGDFSTPVNEDIPISLYAPTTFDAGSSFSHLDESAFGTPSGGPADPDALMTPFLARGEAIHSPGEITCAMFEDFGWAIGNGCEALLKSIVDVDRVPEVGTDMVSDFYPNPAVDEASAVVQASSTQAIRIEIFDAAGRLVRRLPDQHIFAGETREISVDTGSLARGVYFLRIHGSTIHSTKSVIIVGH